LSANQTIPRPFDFVLTKHHCLWLKLRQFDILAPPSKNPVICCAPCQPKRGFRKHSITVTYEKGMLMARSKFKHKRKRHKANVRLKRRKERERGKEEKQTEEQTAES
jgi:hypothetical protein